MNSKALITGITGQDGTYLTKFLLSKGYEVYGLLSGLPGRDNFDNFAKLDLPENQIKKILFTDLANLDLNGFEIYNLAAQSSVGASWMFPKETFEANMDRYIELLGQCKDKDVKILQACSAEMYGDHGDIALSEETQMHPNNPYALSKYSSFLYGKMLRESSKMWISNAILFNHESKLRDKKFVLRKVIDAARDIKDKKIEFIELGNLEVYRDWGFAEDYVEAMWKILQHDTPVDVNVGTGKSIALKEIIEYVFKYFGLSDFEQYIRINNSFIRPTDIKYIKADTSKFKSLNIELNPVSADNIKRLI